MAFVSAAPSARSYSASDRVGRPVSSVVRVIGNGIHDGLNQAREQSKIAAADGGIFQSRSIRHSSHEDNRSSHTWQNRRGKTAGFYYFNHNTLAHSCC